MLLSTYRFALREMNEMEEERRMAGLSTMYAFIDRMGWLSRLFLMMQIYLLTSGGDQVMLLEPFEMHRWMKEIISRPPPD